MPRPKPLQVRLGAIDWFQPARSSLADKMKEINILFPSAGRRVELLRAFRVAFEELAVRGRIVATDIDPLAPAFQVADRTYLVPRLDSPDYIPELVAICRREAIHAVFPLIDPDISRLAENRDAIQATGARLATVSPEAAAIAGDKWATTEFFRQLELKTPQTWLPEMLEPGEARFPLIIKPRRGSAGQDVYRVTNRRELEFFKEYVPNPVIQEFIPGPEITCDVICDFDGELLGIGCRRRIQVRGGEVAKGVTIYDPRIVEACVRIARALPAIGPITVQCMMWEDVPYFTEINARFGGGVPLSIAAGIDAPRWLVARLAGIPIDLPPLGSYRVGLYMTRFDDSFFLTDVQREEMARCRF